MAPRAPQGGTGTQPARNALPKDKGGQKAAPSIRVVTLDPHPQEALGMGDAVGLEMDFLHS